MSDRRLRQQVGPFARWVYSPMPYLLGSVSMVVICLFAITGHDWILALNAGGFAVVWLVFPVLRQGWVAGAQFQTRIDVINTSREAIERGMSWDEWYHAEYERIFGRLEL